MKTKSITIRLSPADLGTIQQGAASAKLHLSEFVRRASMDQKVFSVVDQSAVFELRRLGALLKHLYPKDGSFSPAEKKQYWAVVESLRTVADQVLRGPDAGQSHPENQ